MRLTRLVPRIDWSRVALRYLPFADAATPDLPVVIKADASIQYQKVVEVLDVVTRLEIGQLGLVTQKLVK